MNLNLKQMLVPLMTVSLLVGCNAKDETKGSESQDGGEESSAPKNLESKYCAASAGVLEFKNGKYLFHIDENRTIETAGGYDNGQLNLTATLSMQGQDVDVTITGKPDATGKELSLVILVSNDGEKYYEQKIFAQAASDCPQIEVADLPQFAGTTFDLGQVKRITRFRSSYGHSYSDSFETCRSMKHYFESKEQVDRYIKLYAPFKARVVSLSNESSPNGDDGINNQHLILQSVEYPALQFDFFHIELAAQLPLGAVVEPGTELGWGDMIRNGQPTNSIDIAVWVNTDDGYRLVSMFDVLSNEALAEYNAWSGLSARSDYQISQADRDANPIQCSGESFVDEDSEPLRDLNWIDGL